MQKDIFNGNIKKEYVNYVRLTLVVVSVLFFAFSIFFLLFALLYEKIEYAARIFMLAFSGMCFVTSFLYPIVSIYAIRNYSKHPKFAQSMIKPFVFQNFESDMIQYLTERDFRKGTKKN